MPEFTTVRYEQVAEHIVRITLNRPQKRNAQNHTMTYELNDAFDAACADNDVKVIILAGSGPHFNAGHDQVQRGELSDIRTVGTWYGYDLPGIEGLMSRNKETYFDLVWRWRNIPKPIIGQAHGKTIGGGLMLLSICDIIIASDDAEFADPTVSGGSNGVEYFGHPWDFGARRAKELLFTGGWFSAQDAYDAGFVNRVVARERLEESVLAMARRIARQPSIGLKLSKEAVNGALDAQGQYTALRAAFSLCSINHAQILLRGRPEGLEGELPLRRVLARSDDPPA